MELIQTPTPIEESIPLTIMSYLDWKTSSCIKKELSGLAGKDVEVKKYERKENLK